jgi:hypothetical protein
MPGTPWSLNALLRVFDQRQINPLTNLPMNLQDIHPVLTPQMDRHASYVNGVRALKLRGWNGVSEERDDARAFEKYHSEEREPPKQRRLLNNRHGSALDAEDPRPSLTDISSGMSNIALPKPLWERFNVDREAHGLIHARHLLDRELCRLDFFMLKVRAETQTHQYVAAFLARRHSVWTQPHANMRPIWLALDDLHADFVVLYTQLVSPVPPTEGRTRIIAMMLAWAEQHADAFIADLYASEDELYDSEADQSAIVFGMAPFRLAYLLENATIEEREWFRVARDKWSMVERFATMEARRRRPPFKLALGLSALYKVVADFFEPVAGQALPFVHRGVAFESPLFILRDEDPHIHFPPYANPTDPYTSEDTLNRLQDALRALEPRPRT